MGNDTGDIGVSHVLKCFMCYAKEFGVDTTGIGELLKDFK